MKIWLFYDNKDLCGWTSNKEIKDKYKLERPNCKCKKEDMNEYKYKWFTSFYSDCQLFENVVYDGKDTLYPITSYKENDELEHQLHMMVYEIENLLHELDKYPIKKKYKDVITDALTSFVTNDLAEPSLNFDVTSVYIKKVSTYFNHDV